MRFKLVLVVCLILLVAVISLGVYLGINSQMMYETPDVSLDSITATGRLGVLSAHVNILNSLTMGAASNPDYMKLYGQDGTAVYTVDLSQAEISKGTNSKGESMIFVRLPEPWVQLYIDESSTKNIAEFQKNQNWTGSAEEGYLAYNTQNATGYQEMLDSLQESDGLMLEAKNCAIRRVSELVSAIALDDVQCEIYFSDSRR